MAHTIWGDIVCFWWDLSLNEWCMPFSKFDIVKLLSRWLNRSHCKCITHILFNEGDWLNWRGRQPIWFRDWYVPHNVTESQICSPMRFVCLLSVPSHFSVQKLFHGSPGTCKSKHTCRLVSGGTGSTNPQPQHLKPTSLLGSLLPGYKPKVMHLDYEIPQPLY